MGATIAGSILRKNYSGPNYQEVVRSKPVSKLSRIKNPVQEQTFDYRRTTYRQTRLVIRNTALNLKQNFDIGLGDRVIIFGPNHHWWIGIFAGITSIGAIACPPQPNLKKELDAILKQVDPALILHPEGETNSRLEDYPAQSCTFEEIVQPPENEKSLEKFIGEDLVTRDDKIATLMPTSGTTGRPKLPMLRDKNIIENIKNILHLIQIDENDFITSIAPFHHIMGLTTTAILPAREGATLNYISERYLRSSRQILCDTNTSILLGVPKFYQLFLEKIKKEHPWLYEHRPKLLGWLIKKFVFGKDFRCCISGGAQLTRTTCSEFNDRLEIPLINGMGMTENGPVVSGELDGIPGSIGKPVGGTAAKIEEPDENGYGELLIQGSSLFSGYFGQQETTEKAFKRNWFCTGDIVRYREDGKLEYKGRASSEFVLSNGENIQPEEIEELMVSLGEHPYINEFIIQEGTKNEKSVVEIAVEVGKLNQFKEDLKNHLNGVTQEHLLISELEAIRKKLKSSDKNLTKLAPEELVKIKPIREVLERTIKQAINKRKKDLANYKYPKSTLLVSHLPRNETHAPRRGVSLEEYKLVNF